MKHKKTLFLIYLFILFIIKVNGQSLSPTLISNAGNYSTNINNSMTWTIGDLVVSTQRNNNNILTQGFLQVYKNTVATQDEAFSNNFSFMPNPVSQNFRIENRENQNIDQYILYDYLGKAILKGTNNEPHLEIDFSSIINGSYILQLTAGSKIIKHKIIKQ